MVIAIFHGVSIVLLVILNFKYQHGDYSDGGGVDKSNNGVDHDQWQLHFLLQINSISRSRSAARSAAPGKLRKARSQQENVGAATKV